MWLEQNHEKITKNMDFLEKLPETLREMADPAYRDFNARIIPGAGEMLGIRIPQLELIENVLKFDSKLLMVRDAQGKTVGMLTVNDVLLELLGKEYPDDAAAAA